MTPFMITDIAQMKQAEINTLTEAVATLERAVETRQALVDSLTARAKHFQERLAQADGARASALAHLNQARSAQSAANGLADACADSHRQIADLDKAMDGVAGAKVELVRQLAFVATLLEKAAHLANKQKSLNPQVPDSLVEQLGKATGDCANVLSQALVAQDTCLTTSAGLSTTSGTLDLARSQADTLRHELQPGAHHMHGLLGHLEHSYQACEARYEAELAASSNATTQLDHATAALATAKAKLASMRAGLAAVGGVAA